MLFYSPYFVRREGQRQACLLIIQCDFGHADGDLIACARYRIYDMRTSALQRVGTGPIPTTHVLFIIHLPVQAVQSSFVGFQGDPWVSCHIDDLKKGTLTLEVTQGVPISDLFYGGTWGNHSPSVVHQMHAQCTRLNSCIQAAVSRECDFSHNKQRAIKRVEVLVDHIPQMPSFPLSE